MENLKINSGDSKYLYGMFIYIYTIFSFSQVYIAFTLMSFQEDFWDRQLVTKAEDRI